MLYGEFQGSAKAFFDTCPSRNLIIHYKHGAQNVYMHIDIYRTSKTYNFQTVNVYIFMKLKTSVVSLYRFNYLL